MVYPTLLAAIGDVALPSWRASAVGVYRLWRDLGYAVGALLAGLTADAMGLSAAMWVVAAITFESGAVVAFRMDETSRNNRFVDWLNRWRSAGSRDHRNLHRSRVHECRAYSPLRMSRGNNEGIDGATLSCSRRQPLWDQRRCVRVQP
jgi:MFS family permease